MEPVMTCLRCLTPLVLLSAISLAEWNSPSSIAPFMDTLRTQLIVIVRDARTNEILADPRIDIERMKDNSTDYQYASEFWGDAICQIVLGKGTYRLRVVADGYMTRIVDNIHILAGDPGAIPSSCGGAQPLSFFGTTVVLGVLLEPKEGAKAGDQVRPFLCDTTFYYQPEVPAQPSGGIEALKKKIDLSAYVSTSTPDRNRRPVRAFAHTFIDRNGKVLRVEMVGEGVQQEIGALISNAIYNTKFTPARMLGMAVSSQVYIPFELNLSRR